MDILLVCWKFIQYHHRVQNSSGACPSPFPMGTGGSFSGGKAVGARSWPLIPF